MSAVHVPHDSLPHYDERNVYHDGCPVCEDRAKHPLGALGHLDHTNMLKLWRDMRAEKWPGGAGVDRNLSLCDARMLSALYLIAVFLQRMSIDPEEIEAKLQASSDNAERALQQMGLGRPAYPPQQDSPAW